MKSNIKILEIEKRWLTTKDAMDYLGVKRRWLDGLRENALISFYKVQGTIFYKKADLDKLVEKNRVI